MLNNKRRTHTAVTVGLCAILAGTGAVATNVAGGGCSLALASTQTPDENAAIEFKDENLKKVLLRILKSQNKIDRNAQQITYKEALTVEDLSTANNHMDYTLGRTGITNLSGLEAFKNLKYLDIGNNSIKDLKPLAKLTKLEYLEMARLNKEGPEPLDINPLSGLTALTHLTVNYNHIKDIKALANMTKLEFLSMVVNDITDISPLKNCKKLTKLYARNNNIEDLSPLADIPDFEGGNIKDQKIAISASGDSVKLSDCSYMRFVKSWDDMSVVPQNGALYDKATKTATPAAGQSQATYKFFYNKGIEINGTITISFNTAKPIDIKDATLKQALLSLLKKNSIIKSDATTITNVDAEKVTDLSGLADEISNLGKKVNDLSGLEAFSNLTKLSLKDNEISDLSPLGKLEKLAEVDLSKNKITDLKPFQHLEKITKLDLSSNEITDLAPYADQLKKAKQGSITLTSNRISSPISNDLASVIKDATKQRFQITADGKLAQITGEIEGLNPNPAVDDISWTVAATKQGALEPAVALLEKIPADPKDVVLTLKKDKWSADYHINFQAYLDGLQKKVTDSTADDAEKTRVSNLIKTAGTPLYSIKAAIVGLGKSKTEGTDPDTGIENASDALLSLLQSAEDVKKTENYTNADTEKQKAYTDAITAGKTVYDKLSSTPEQVKTAAEKIKTALGNLNGDAKAKTALKKKLQDLVGALDTIKASNNYKNADQGLQTAYTQAVAKGQTVLDNTNASSDDLRTAISNIEDALGKLNGDNQSLKERLQALVDDLSKVKATNNYSNADEKLQGEYTKAITAGQETLSKTDASAADFRTAASNIEAALKNLNGDANSKDALKKKLQGLVGALDTVKASNNYSNADKSFQDEYSKAITAGQGTLKKSDASAEDYRKAAEAIQTALNGLNGDAKKIKDLTASLAAANAKITQMTEDLKKAKEQAAADKAKIETLTTQVNGLNTKVDDLSKQVTNLTKDNKQKQQTIEEKEKKITELTNEVTKLKNEIDALKKQIEELKKQPQCPSGGSSTGGSGLGGSGFGGAGLGLIGDLDNLSNSSSSAALYRLYNPWTGEHLFSVDYGEVEKLCPLGWTFEGIVASVDLASGKPVYRLYNPWTGDHHYTTDLAEVVRNEKIGWKNEGIAFYSKGKVGVVSLYNPFAKSFYHHYTTDPAEVERMVKDGWKEEGVKWYCSLPANNKK